MTVHKMGSVDKWRKFFETAEADICSVIEYAILVAASDCPNEFRRRRDKIAERLYTSRFLRCCECDAAVPQPEDHIDNGENDDDDGINKGSNNAKVTSSSDDADDADRNRVSNYSYDEAEALTEEIEEESQILREVFRIKDILANRDESDSQLIESLRRLELMQLSVEILKATDVGRKVNKLRKHKSKTICSMAKNLVSSWKELADEWMKTAGNVAVAAIAGTSTDSVSPATADDENGLPSPPLEDVAFLATQTTSIEMSQFFDGMDDDGNPRIPDTTENDGDEEGEKQLTVQELPKRKQQDYQSYSKRDASHCSKQETATDGLKNGGLRRDAQVQSEADRHVNLMRGANYMIASSGPGRPPIVSQERKSYEENVQQKLDSNKQQIKSSSLPSQHKLSSPEDKSVKVKIEAAKRRLQEGYQQAEKAKKQRTVQVMELQDLPKQGHNHVRPFHGKPVPQHHRQGMNNRM
ncbi:probable mediator of RNA polymerase II transcription subunit 26b isoform X2 [Cryptomeria japonica]|uniref:probable mediator of RNA polymerase II transcription subunit 26b isoform X2 n=1 Tax=Cryptomeria japonica TaxID=3369 RepID=UPI0025ACC7A2|nr:probable mediator of RNA polymerase II transcription subunit 26b isoform X2 [Cryptomeria japonica]